MVGHVKFYGAAEAPDQLPDPARTAIIRRKAGANRERKLASGQNPADV
jgi:hypothetical protein